MSTHPLARLSLLALIGMIAGVCCPVGTAAYVVGWALLAGALLGTGALVMGGDPDDTRWMIFRAWGVF